MIKIALLGYGVVGRGAYRILKEKQNDIEFAIGENVIVSKVLVRDISKLPLELRNIATTNFSDILADSEIKIVVEMTGSFTQGYEYIVNALKAKKHVVTANKAIVSEHFKELHELARKNNVSFLFEAAVAGSIPIISPLIIQTTLNNIKKVRGILNGTSNYLLSRMYNECISYQDVLKDAQELGYAERDPFDDVEGVDALRKLCILSTISYKGIIHNEDILRQGMSNISILDIEYFKEKGLKPKLIAQSCNEDEGFCAIVEPVLIPKNDKLFYIDGADNAVEIYGQYYSSLLFGGEGAGSTPTGNAIVSDILAVLCSNRLNLNLSNSMTFWDGFKGHYYVRVPKKSGIDIKTISYEEREEYLIFKTAEISRKELIEKLTDIDDCFIARYEE